MRPYLYGRTKTNEPGLGQRRIGRPEWKILDTLVAAKKTSFFSRVCQRGLCTTQRGFPFLLLLSQPGVKNDSSGPSHNGLRWIDRKPAGRLSGYLYIYALGPL